MKIEKTILNPNASGSIQEECLSETKVIFDNSKKSEKFYEEDWEIYLYRILSECGNYYGIKEAQNSNKIIGVESI